jgi:hypothetical protein
VFLDSFVQIYQLIASEHAYSTQSGHKELPGFQRILCHPFTIMPYRGGGASGPDFCASARSEGLPFESGHRAFLQSSSLVFF